MTFSGCENAIQVAVSEKYLNLPGAANRNVLMFPMVLSDFQKTSRFISVVFTRKRQKPTTPSEDFRSGNAIQVAVSVHEKVLDFPWCGEQKCACFANGFE